MKFAFEKDIGKRDCSHMSWLSALRCARWGKRERDAQKSREARLLEQARPARGSWLPPINGNV